MGRRRSRARNQRESRCLFFNPENAGDMFLRNVGSFSTGYTAFYLFITTGVRTSNPIAWHSLHEKEVFKVFKVSDLNSDTSSF
jgi:hypothetical protein